MQKVIIIGAGVAGLSLAIMLSEQNIDCEVLEARRRFDGPTSGVRISAEGVAILNALKLGPIGEETNRLDMRFGCLSASFSAGEQRPAAIMVTRLALHEQLMKRALALGIVVRTDFRLAKLSELDGGVEVTSQLGESVTGTLLVGADGVGSTVRQILNPGSGSTKTFAGYLGVGLIAGDDAKIEMTLYKYPGQEVGIASCGKVNEEATKRGVFLWTHLHMSEAEANLATRVSVKKELARRAERWGAELRTTFDRFLRDPDAILAYGPVYNGRPPARWFNDRTILCGDAAHPYGPGGQGISMALKDARALCDVIGRGFLQDDKEKYQKRRAQEARRFGEAAEKRNAKAPPSSRWGVLREGLAMKANEILSRGRLTF